MGALGLLLELAAALGEFHHSGVLLVGLLAHGGELVAHVAQLGKGILMMLLELAVVTSEVDVLDAGDGTCAKLRVLLL